MRRNNKLVTATVTTGESAALLNSGATAAGGTRSLHRRRSGSPLPADSQRVYGRARRVPRLAQAGFFQLLPPWIWVLTGTLVLLGLLSKNPLLTAACVLTLPILGSLLWRKGESQILLFGCTFQWLQVVAALFDADFRGASLDELSAIPNMEKATWLSLIGMWALALGERVALVRRPVTSGVEAEAEARSLNPVRMFIIWLCAWFLASVTERVAWYVPGLAQPVIAVASLKWLFLFIMAYGVVVQSRGFGWLLIAFLIEFVTGWLGIFGQFKEVLYMVIVAAASVRSKLDYRSRALVVISVVVGVVAALLWSSIKMEYRAFLQDGGVGNADRFLKLSQLISEVDLEKANASVDVVVSRVAYVEFFARTLSYVPEMVPYARGKLWLDAVTRLLMPRLLFPNKEGTNDSDRTNQYAGVSVSGGKGSDSGTSIGIGYMGESYIDFGLYLMFVPIFLMGFVFGNIYRHFVFRNRSHLLGCAIASAVLFNTKIETSNIKILGGVITVCLLMLVYDLVIGTKALNWLKGGLSGGRASGRRIPRA